MYCGRLPTRHRSEGGRGLAGRKARPLHGDASSGAVWPSASWGPPATRLALQYDYLCLGGFSSFLCLLVSGLHFKVYNKCFGVGSPHRTSLWQVRSLGAFPGRVPWAPSETRVRAHPEGDFAAGRTLAERTERQSSWSFRNGSEEAPTATLCTRMCLLLLTLSYCKALHKQ